MNSIPQSSISMQRPSELATGVFADQAEYLVADGGHFRFARRFHVEPEQRLGVRRTDVEPPRVPRDGETVQLVEGNPGPFGVNALDLRRRGGLVGDLAVDLAAVRVAGELAQDGRQRAGVVAERG